MKNLSDKSQKDNSQLSKSIFAASLKFLYIEQLDGVFTKNLLNG